MTEATQRGRGGPNGRLTWIIIIGLILAVIVLAAFISLRRARIGVRIGDVERGTLTARSSSNGKIAPIDSFEAQAPVATTGTRL